MYSRLSVNAQFFSKVSMVIGKVKPVNFSPPPQVDSSVVRLEPRTDRPKISFDEFDGMLRVCFGRKNKTIHGCWAVKQVRAMMVRNYITWAAMFAERVCEGDKVFLVEGGDDADVEEDVDMDEDVDMEGGGGGGVLAGASSRVRAAAASAGVVTIGGVQAERGRVDALVRRKTEAVFEKTGLGGQRAAKLDEQDFLTLLFAFNEEGLHFS